MLPSTDTGVWVSASSSADNAVASSGVIRTGLGSLPTLVSLHNRGRAHGLREPRQHLFQRAVCRFYMEPATCEPMRSLLDLVLPCRPLATLPQPTLLMNTSAAIADPLLRRAFGRRARPSDPRRTARVRSGPHGSARRSRDAAQRFRDEPS